MTTLAQISATFIAITAGFYTTKIISTINDKSRLNGRIKETDLELKYARKVQQEVRAEIDEINYKNREKWKEHLTEYFIHLTEYEAVNSLKDLQLAYEKQYDSKPDIWI